MGLLQEVTTVHHHDQAVHPLHHLVQPGLLHPLAKQGGASQRFAGGYHHRADPEPDQQLAGDHHHQRHPNPGPCWRNTWGRRNNHTSSTSKCGPDRCLVEFVIPNNNYITTNNNNTYNYNHTNNYNTNNYHHYNSTNNYNSKCYNDQVWWFVWWGSSLLIFIFHESNTFNKASIVAFSAFINSDLEIIQSL